MPFLKEAIFRSEPEILTTPLPQWVSPSKPIESFKKIVCSRCGSVHIMALDKTTIVPPAVACRLCGLVIPLNRVLKRLSGRYPSNENILLLNDNQNPFANAHLLDFSAHGARIYTTQKMDPSQSIILGAPHFEAQGIPMWMKNKNGIYELGLQFENFKAKIKAIIIDMKI